MLSKYMDIGSIKSISINLSANRSEYNGVKDDSIFLSASFPLSNGANVGYSLNNSRYDTTSRATYYDRIDDRTTYQLSAGSSKKGGMGSAFITHQSDVARLAVNASYMHNQYSAFGVSASGGMTLTAEGGACIVSILQAVRGCWLILMALPTCQLKELEHQLPQICLVKPWLVT